MPPGSEWKEAGERDEDASNHWASVTPPGEERTRVRPQGSRPRLADTTLE